LYIPAGLDWLARRGFLDPKSSEITCGWRKAYHGRGEGTLQVRGRLEGDYAAWFSGALI